MSRNHLRIRRTGAALVVALALATGTVPRAAETPSWAAAADAVFADVATRESPGCALAVYQNGRTSYERGYGMADLEHDVPIAADTVFYVGSLSKQFTAFAIALAAGENKLAVTDDVRKWIPELPEYGAPTTVRHLLHHTSGLRDYNTLLDIVGRRNDEAFDNRIVLDIVARQRALNFPPGDQFLYSNSGYVLLSLIVERATGQTLADYAQAKIFAPLGMRDTQFYDDVTRIVKRRSAAYARSGAGWRDNTPHSQRTGAGGLLTTVRDLLAWDNNFQEPKVGTRALIARVHETGSLNSGAPLTYAYGLRIGKYRGQNIVEHGGSLGGYRAHLIRLPELRTSVSCLCNFDTSDPAARARRVADAVLGGRLSEAVPSAAPAAPARNGNGAERSTMPAERLKEYVGRYDSAEADTTFAIETDGRAVLLKRERDKSATPLRPLESDRFAFRGMVIRFTREHGRVVGLAVDAGRVEDIRFTRRTGS